MLVRVPQRNAERGGLAAAILSSIAHIPMEQALSMGLGVQSGGASRFIAELGPSKPKPVPGSDLLD